jgi:three-Cys-motif partner protein
VSDPYSGREQTKAKHFILKRYLEALAFKVLNFSDITYVDGFSGPWETKTEDFADSSFMIALRVLKDAQHRMTQRRIKRRIRCLFSEADPAAYVQLAKQGRIENTWGGGSHKPTDANLILFESDVICRVYETDRSERRR